MLSLAYHGYRQRKILSLPRRLSSLSRWHLCWLGCMGAAWILGLLPGVSCAEGRIQGSVQGRGQLFAEQRIMLIRFGPHQEVQRTPGQTDAAGRFVFENLATGPEFTYFVGMRYQERLYRSAPIILQGAEPAEVVLEVDAPLVPDTADGEEQPELRIVNHLMVIVERNAHLEVREVVRIVNRGSTPVAGKRHAASSASVAFHLPLPQGYYQLSPIQGLAAEHIRTDVSGLSYTAPLDPGEHRVIYTYSLPRQGLTTLLLERTLPTTVLDVLVQDAHFTTTSDLQFGGRVTIDPHVFAHFRGTNLAAQSRSWLQLIPQSASLPVVPVVAYSLVIGLTLLGVALPFHQSGRGQAQPEQRAKDMPASTQDLRRASRHVLQSIARLDEQHDKGLVEDSIYVQRRQAYKEQLVTLVKQFQGLQTREERRCSQHEGAV